MAHRMTMYLIILQGEMGTSPAQPKGTSEVNDGTQTPYSSSFEPLSTPLVRFVLFVFSNDE